MVSTILSNAILLSLTFHRIYGNSEPSIYGLRQHQHNLGNENPIPASSQANTHDSMAIGWKWPFNLKHLSPTETTNRNILFPGIVIEPQKLTARTSADVPTCKGKTFCANVSNYPEKLLDAILDEKPELRGYKNIDEMDAGSRIEISQRDFYSNDALCPRVEDIIYPQTGKIKGKTWMYILNGQDIKQGVRVEICMNEGQSCDIIGDHPQGYKFRCKQKYVYRQLIAATPNGTVSKELFRFPASCCCHSEFIGPENLFKIGGEAFALGSNRD